MENLVNALKDFLYANRGKESSMDKLVNEVGSVKSLQDYVTNLASRQKKGIEPIFSIVDDAPTGLTPVRLDLYWNPKTQQLDLDYDDAHPYCSGRRNLT